MTDELLTVAELAERLDLPQAQVRDWVSRQKLQPRGTRLRTKPRRLVGTYSLAVAVKLAERYRANQSR